MGSCRTCLIFLTIQIISLANAQEWEKRVPQGFLGMRGKKDIDDMLTEQFYKRKPQFFVGVKGKKSLQDILETGEDFNKRMPFGFVVSRSKNEIPNTEFVPKRDGSWIGQINYKSRNRDEAHHNDDTLPIFSDIWRQVMKKIERPNSTPAPLELDPEYEPMYNSNEISKRVANNIHQFFGMRGKKSYNKRPYDLSFRGKFIGVRGKKDTRYPELREVKFLLDSPMVKRKSQLGFFGMRGKKWIDSNEFIPDLSENSLNEVSKND